MLHIFRKKGVQRKLLLILLIIIIPPFVMWGFDSAVNKEPAIGRIGNKEIKQGAFQESLIAVKATIMLSYYGNYELFSNIVRNRPMMNRYAWDRLIFLSAADKNGTKVPDSDVFSFIRSQPIFTRSNGQFDPDIYDQVIRKNLGLELRNFEEIIRDNLRIQAFQISLAGEVTVPDSEIAELFSLFNGKVDLSYFVVTKEKYMGTVSPDPKEVQDYYAEHSREMVAPHLIELEYAALPYTKTNRREVIEKMHASYEKMLTYPTEFQKISNEDGLRYQKSGEISVNDLIPGIKFSKDIHNAAFSMANGEITTPISSGEAPGEMYLLHKLRDIPEKALSFEESKGKITEILMRQKSLIMAGTVAANLYKEIRENLTPLEEVSKQVYGTARSVKDITLNSYLDDAGAANTVVEKALKAKPQEVLAPIECAKGYIIARLEKITPGDPELFNKQKDLITSQLVRAKREDIMTKWLAEKAPKTKLIANLDEL
ncbi:MAG: peptidylprolyl isomerase [Candidatus Omnitrophica bacterium]|nr:peptidylprolyl isomerase [Candidatus Omnitrophota bacterium]